MKQILRWREYWRKRYEAELRRIGPEQEISHLPKKKRGTPLTLGELDGKVRIVIAAAEGFIKATDHTMLIENGGHIQLTLA